MRFSRLPIWASSALCAAVILAVLVAVDVLDRSAATGALTQKSRRAGCLAASVPQSCALGRGLLGVSSIAVGPDGSFVYSAAFASNAVSVFKRVTKTVSRPTGRG